MTDYGDEILHWKQMLASDEASGLDQKRRVGNFPVPLLPCVGWVWNELGRAPRVVDVGAGPLSQLAWGVETGLIDLLAVDPLADEYGAMLAERGIEYPVKPVRGTGEELDRLLAPASLDIAFSNNALDHADSPAECLRQMAKAVRPGAFIVIISRLREGTNESWHGLHQHDLVPIEGALWRFDRRANGTDLSTGLGLACLCQFKTGERPGDEFILVFRKSDGAAAGEPAMGGVPLRRAIPRLVKRINASTVTRTDQAVRKAMFPSFVLSGDRSVARVLATGSGPFSRLGWGVEAGLLEVAAIDSQASYYSEIAHRCGYQFPIYPSEGATDDSSRLAGLGVFDAVYDEHGMDDAASLRGALSCLRSVVRPSGRIIVEGSIGERTLHSWSAAPFRDVAWDGRTLLVDEGDGGVPLSEKIDGFVLLEASAESSTPGAPFRFVLRKA